MITYLLPTRNRPERLGRTLERLGRLSPRAHAAVGDAEVVVVDDASCPRARVPRILANGFPVRLVRLDRPRGAAARNAGVATASGTWIVMLDDDSAPLDDGAVVAVEEVGAGMAAIGGNIDLPDGTHEHGGLPEVIVGCGCIVRRDVFEDVGGYDRRFHYYVEEYDLCAKMIGAGWSITHDWRFRVRHDKVAQGRDRNAILARLVRNNGWLIRRYAPPAERVPATRRMIERYAAIAAVEDARFGFETGLGEMVATLDRQPSRTLSSRQWERFTGAAHIALATGGRSIDGARVALVARGKHAELIEAAVVRAGGELVDDARAADVQVIGTLAPGPLVDAWTRHVAGPVPVVRPWTPPFALDASAGRRSSSVIADPGVTLV